MRFVANARLDLPMGALTVASTCDSLRMRALTGDPLGAHSAPEATRAYDCASRGAQRTGAKRRMRAVPLALPKLATREPALLPVDLIAPKGARARGRATRPRAPAPRPPALNSNSNASSQSPPVSNATGHVFPLSCRLAMHAPASPAGGTPERRIAGADEVASRVAQRIAPAPQTSRPGHPPPRPSRPPSS